MKIVAIGITIVFVLTILLSPLGMANITKLSNNNLSRITFFIPYSNDAIIIHFNGEHYLHGDSTEVPNGRYRIVTTSNEVAHFSHWITTGRATVENTSSNPSWINIVSDCTLTACWVKVQAPEMPVISGPRSGKIGEEYEYSFVSTQPQGLDVKYYIDWDGDYQYDERISLSPSGETVTLPHVWDEKGAYTIRAKAAYDKWTESPWAAMTVNIAKSKPNLLKMPFLQQLFQNLIFNKIFDLR